MQRKAFRSLDPDHRHLARAVEGGLGDGEPPAEGPRRLRAGGRDQRQTVFGRHPVPRRPGQCGVGQQGAGGRRPAAGVGVVGQLLRTTYRGQLRIGVVVRGVVEGAPASGGSTKCSSTVSSSTPASWSQAASPVTACRASSPSATSP